jgi:cysteine desulfurase/selenocysteine lyase
MAYGAEMTHLDVDKIRQDFPQLTQKVRGKPLVYLDNAATTLKPTAVLQALDTHYRYGAANIHRGVHFLSEKATEEFDSARRKIQKFIHAAEDREIIFTSGTTDSINLVAQSFGQRLQKGDEIILTHMEHHSNIVPWQMLRERTGCVLRVVPITKSGELDLAAYAELLGPRTKLVSVTHVSNALGTVNPLSEIIQQAKARGAVVLIDGAQAVAHMQVDVQALGCDFYAFSGHKLFGPTGVGVLYGRAALLESMPPVKGGGDMIRSVTFDKTIYNDLPYKFEAGTPAIAEVIALGAAVDYVSGIGFAAIAEHEQKILQSAHAALQNIPGVCLVGTAQKKSGVVSFTIKDIHPHDVGTLVDEDGIAIRTGHHCAQPVMDFFGIPATSRASFSIYNTEDDISALVSAIKRVIEVFK